MASAPRHRSGLPARGSHPGPSGNAVARAHGTRLCGVRPEDGHTNLGWEDALGGLVTHPLPDGARFGLCIAELTLVLLDSSNSKDTFALDGRRDADACEWLGRHARARGLEAQALDAALPYGLPALAGGGAYTAAALAEPLADLAMWFSNANGVLEATRQRLAA